MYSRQQLTDLTYMGGTRPCGPMTIICTLDVPYTMTIVFGSVIQSQHTSLNIKFGVNGNFHVLKTPVTELTYMGGTGPCEPIKIIFHYHIQSQYTSLNVKYTQYTDITYMGVTRPCGPMTIIFRSVIQSQHTCLNIKFGVNRTFHVLKTTVD